MRATRRVAGVAAAVVAVVMLAQFRLSGQTPSPGDAHLQYQLATLLWDEARYVEALEAYQRATRTDDRDLLIRARIGVVRASLVTGRFDDAQAEGERLLAEAPTDHEAITAHADAVWSAGLFDEAEAAFRRVLQRVPDSARARHGLARALASEWRLDDALVEAQAALRLSPRDAELHHTLGTVYERMHRFEEAALAYGSYVNLLPNKEKSEKALWSRAQIRFLRAFRDRQPMAVAAESRGRLHTVPFKLVDDKVVVQAKVNGGRLIDFVLDTGSEQTTLSRQVAERAGMAPITYTLAAGVGEVGLRGLQLSRIDRFEVGTLALSDVPALIKNPSLKGIPKREMESFSPLALGLSMVVDYGTRRLTIGERLPEEPADLSLPMRVHRLAMVRGELNDGQPRYFVVDTGGEVISISQETALALNAEPRGRRIQLRVFGTSGWDRDAFLMPGVKLRFEDLLLDNYAVVVLNMRAPSVLLGFQLGGIVGHRFLSPYRVALDLQRAEMRLTRLNSLGTR